MKNQQIWFSWVYSFHYWSDRALKYFSLYIYIYIYIYYDLGN